MTTIITRADAQGGLETAPVEEDKDKATALVRATRETVELDGRKDFFALRKRWSGWIIAWISVLILFNSLLAVLVGLDVLKFSAAPWFITAVTVETFLQVIGLGYVAAKFLFSHPHDEREKPD